MSKATQEILKKLKLALANIYGKQLEGLYLYGSYARGEGFVEYKYIRWVLKLMFNIPWRGNGELLHR